MPADCLSSRPRCGPGLAHPAGPGQPSATARAHPRSAGPEPRGPEAPQVPRQARASPTGSAKSCRATNASTCADARSSHCASSTIHSSGRSSAASGSAPPARPETGPAHPRRAARTRPRARHAAEPEAAPGDRAAARTADEGWRTPAPALIAPPRPRITRISAAAPTAAKARRDAVCCSARSHPARHGCGIHGGCRFPPLRGGSGGGVACLADISCKPGAILVSSGAGGLLAHGAR